MGRQGAFSCPTVLPKLKAPKQWTFTELNQAISTSDLALLSAFYILASSDRGRIRRALLDRATFKSQLDDSQGWIIDLVGAYVDANYGQVMSLLQYSEVCPFFFPLWLGVFHSHISIVTANSSLKSLPLVLHPLHHLMYSNPLHHPICTTILDHSHSDYDSSI